MQLVIELPDWLADLNRDPRRLDPDAAMRLAISTAERNIDCGGGPFGAVMVDADGALISVGANRVIASHASFLHAEMLALLLAQQKLGTHDLSSQGTLTLYSTCEPCAMCLGALPFSGIAELICGAHEADARRAGFDEGAKPHDWITALQQRGISVTTGFHHDAAADTLRRYRSIGGSLY
ncbi:MAG: nucleoside deaminase [Zoogloeaceae bacterium]|nr:nucleoside deaminase [Zoogloeaceae bacterium]